MRNRPRAGFEASVARTLKQAGVRLSVKPKVGGFQPDFIVTKSDGKRVIFEIKQWAPDAAHIERAAHQSTLFTKAAKVDRTFIVLKDLKTSAPERGVLRPADILRFVGDGPTPRKAPRPTPHAKTRAVRMGRPGVALRSARRANTVFAAMPFAAEFDDVHLVAMVGAAKAAGVTCKRVDREDYEGDIVKEIKRLIRASAAVIADLSGTNPDVLYEVGYAHGVGKQVVPISRTSLKDLPFLVRNENTIPYSAGQTHKLTRLLARRLKAAIGKESA